MTNALKDKLLKEIERVMSKISNEAIDSKRYEILVKRLRELVNTYEVIEKEEHQHDLNCDRAERDIERDRKQHELNCDRAERDIERDRKQQENAERELKIKKNSAIADVLLKAIGIAATTITTVWWVHEGLKFEESGTFRSNTMKDGIRHLPLIRNMIKQP